MDRGSWQATIHGVAESDMMSLSCVQLFETPWTVAHQASLSIEFSGQEYWSGLPFLLQGIFPTQGLNPGLPHCSQILYHLSHQGSLLSEVSEVAQLCPTLSDPVDCSPPGSSVNGILQARILEWVAISFSRGSYWPRDRTQVSRIAVRHFTVWATREVGFEQQTNTGMEYSLRKKKFGDQLPWFSSRLHFSKGRRDFCPHLV